MIHFYIWFKKGPVIALIFALIAVHLHAQSLGDLTVEYRTADSVASLYPNHSIADLKVLSDKLTFGLSNDTDKFRAIYRQVCDNIANDFNLYTQNKRKREKLNDKPEELKEWNKKFTHRVTKKLLDDHATVCTGYAYLIKELSYHAGIDCRIIDGYGRTAHANIGGKGYVNHSWNAVNLHGKWNLCDATWSSGDIDPDKALFIKKFYPAYFLAEPSLFAKNHYPIDTSWMLVKEKFPLKEFLDGPLIYKGAFGHNIFPISPETFNVAILKGKKVTFKFKQLDDAVIEGMQLQTIFRNEMNSIFLEINKVADGIYAVDHEFPTTGSYVVHFLINGDYIFSYNVEVTK